MKRWHILWVLCLVGCQVEGQGFSTFEFFDASQRIRTDEDAEEVRAEMTEFVFGGALPTRFPDDVEWTTDPSFSGHWIQRVSVETEDLTSVVYLIHPISWNGALAVYHQGHGGDFRDVGQETILELLAADYQVLAFSMPMIGMNTHPFETDEHFELDAREHPLRYFIDPVVVALNWAESTYSYSRRIMIGLSGGGWTTVWVAGIDPRIDASYPVAGSWPHYLRDVFGSFGDYEERITPNYLELYVLATHPRREQTQLFAELDTCCFSGLYSYDYLAYTAYRANEWAGRFQILIEHGQLEHGISDYMLGEILDIERAAR